MGKICRRGVHTPKITYKITYKVNAKTIIHANNASWAMRLLQTCNIRLKHVEMFNSSWIYSRPYWHSHKKIHWFNFRFYLLSVCLVYTYIIHKVMKVRGHVHVDKVTVSRNTYYCDVGRPLNFDPDFCIRVFLKWCLITQWQSIRRVLDALFNCVICIIYSFS